MSIEKSVVYCVPEKPLVQIVQGGFSKRIIVIAACTSAEEIDKAFLEKILAAVGLDFYKDTLFAAALPSRLIGLGEFMRKEHPQAILVFGANLFDLGLNINIPKYQPTKFYTSYFLVADTLPEIAVSKEKKSLLWNALKKMFTPQNI